MADVRATAGEAFDLTIGTSPQQSGLTVQLTELYGLSGGAAIDLTLPATMDEGAPGVYSVEVEMPSEGIFWARVDLGGTEHVLLIRVRGEGDGPEDGDAGEPVDIGIVAPTDPASLQISVFDAEGASAGEDTSYSAIVWPQAATAVPGKTDSWFFEDVVFEGGRLQLVITPPSGPSSTDVLTILAAVQTVANHFQGWQPDAAYDPSDWVPLSYVRRWCGWPSTQVSDRDLRELREHAIETFIESTNVWVPAWTGVFHGLRGQGRRLYLPVPILLPQDGGIDPVVEYRESRGEQALVQEISSDDLVWRVRGRDGKQPYIELWQRGWDPTIDVKIRATWGYVGPTGSTPLSLRQAIVGLVRWHSLSFGAGPDEARDKSTMNRTTSESTRDASADYAEDAIGGFVTGDRTTDRVLLEYRVNPGPWIMRDGDRNVP